MDTQTEMAAMRTELASLRRLTRLLLAVSALGLLLGVWAVVRRAGPALSRSGDEVAAVQVQAQEYRLVDPDGGLRGLWHCPPAGPAFTLLDEKGRVALRLYLDAGGAVRVSDAEGRPVFQRP